MPQHLWMTGGLRADRERAVMDLRLPAALLPALLPGVDAHRRRHGPYTAAGAIVRALVPGMLDLEPHLVRRYDIELLSAAPDLAAIVPSSRETLTSMAIPAERTRFYALLRTQRIANGLVEFVTDAVDQLPGSGPRALVVENVEAADATDLEFLAAAVRRVDPSRLTIVVCSATAELPDAALAGELRGRARIVAARKGQALAVGGSADGAGEDGAGEDTAWEFVVSDGTCDDPEAIAAYEALDPGERARLHDRRAAVLEGPGTLDGSDGGERLPSLGALPYHREHGSDPAGAGARALRAAQDYCVCMGFYPAAAEYGERGLALTGPAAEPERWWKFVVAQGLALSVLGRTRAALDLYDQARLASIDPNVHMAAAYSTAMLYTRHNVAEERDPAKAKAWLNSAIATASLVGDPSDRAFQGAFYRNGLALVEINLGSATEALRLVDECIASLDRELRPDEHRLHRSVLKNNRARVYLALGRFDDALADYAVVIAQDPNHAEHYLERGNILRRLGRHDEAAADYATAMRLSPPFPEIYYNRGDLRLSLGDREGALADFGYALELEPALVDAYVNRAGAYLESEDFELARGDAVAGLGYDPGNPHLHAVLGGVRVASGDFAGAVEAYDAALDADPSLVAAWAGRAEAQLSAGDSDGAIESLNAALDVADDAALLFNRATVLGSAGRWADAVADLTRARELDPEDPEITVQLREYAERLAGTPEAGTKVRDVWFCPGAAGGGGMVS
jgi:tetratricopeptide (TPR) repeat protein